MKKLITGWLVVCVACLCFAGSGAKVPYLVANCAANVTNSATGVNRLDGRLYGIYVDVVAGATNTITVATSKETLLTATGVTTDKLYRPRIGYDDKIGVTQGTTNEYFWLISDTVTVTVTSTDLGTNNVLVTLYMIDQ